MEYQFDNMVFMAENAWQESPCRLFVLVLPMLIPCVFTLHYRYPRYR